MASVVNDLLSLFFFKLSKKKTDVSLYDLNASITHRKQGLHRPNQTQSQDWEKDFAKHLTCILLDLCFEEQTIFTHSHHSDH